MLLYYNISLTVMALSVRRDGLGSRNTEQFASNIKHHQFEEQHIKHGCTIFPKISEPPQKF
jgi:hypothetical protein